MKSILFTFFFFLLGSTANCQLVEFFKWTDSKQDVKKYHSSSVLLEETFKNQLDELHFVKIDSGFAHHYIYLFKKDVLEGIKTHRVSLSGNNSKMYALEQYEKLHDKYVNKYGNEKVKVRNAAEQAVKVSELHLLATDIFITIEKNGAEYYLSENFFKKGVRPK